MCTPLLVTPRIRPCDLQLSRQRFAVCIASKQLLFIKQCSEFWPFSAGRRIISTKGHSRNCLVAVSDFFGELSIFLLTIISFVRFEDFRMGPARHAGDCQLDWWHGTSTRAWALWLSPPARARGSRTLHLLQETPSYRACWTAFRVVLEASKTVVFVPQSIGVQTNEIR